MNITGNINLAMLKKVGIASVNGKRCVVIPIEENDLYIKANEDKATAKEQPFKHISFGVNLWQNKDGQVSEYGHTHYAKRSFSKEYREAHPEEENKAYLGNFKPIQMGGNEAATAPAPEAEVKVGKDDELPF